LVSANQHQVTIFFCFYSNWSSFSLVLSLRFRVRMHSPGGESRSIGCFLVMNIVRLRTFPLVFLCVCFPHYDSGAKDVARDISSFVADLGCEVVFENAQGVNFVLDNERLIGVEAKSCVGRKRSCLIKHVKVADGELLVDSLRYLKCQLLLLVSAVMLLHLN